MGAAEDNSVYLLLFEREKIFSGRYIDYPVASPSLFYERDEQRTVLAVYSYLRVKRSYLILVCLARYRRRCPYNTDTSVSCRAYRRLRARFDDPDHGNTEVFGKERQPYRRRGIAGYYYEFYVVLHEEKHVLYRELFYRRR